MPFIISILAETNEKHVILSVLFGGYISANKLIITASASHIKVNQLI